MNHNKNAKHPYVMDKNKNKNKNNPDSKGLTDCHHEALKETNLESNNQQSIPISGDIVEKHQGAPEQADVASNVSSDSIASSHSEDMKRQSLDDRIKLPRFLLRRKEKTGKDIIIEGQDLTGGANKSCTDITFSIFYGNPDPARQELRHVNFEASLNKEFFEHCKRESVRPSGRNARRQQKHENDAEHAIPQLKELMQLAVEVNDDVLEAWGGNCVVCERPAKALVHRPLCCSIDGYHKTVDGTKMRELMTEIAKMAKDLDTDEKVGEAIGSMLEGPYIHHLAVPVCEPCHHCESHIKEKVGDYIQKTLKGINDKLKRQKKGPLQHSGFVEAAAPAATPNENEIKSQGKLQTSLEGANERDTEDMMIPIRLSAFIGKPAIDPNDTPRQYQLTNLVFTSKWHALALISPQVQDREYLPYQLIAAYHEKMILNAAKFRCAVCPERVVAVKLLHRPISFRRDNTYGSNAEDLRQMIFRFFQYVRGKWKDPEVVATLGTDGVCHVNEFVVPICNNPCCEEAARIGAQIFVARQLPAGEGLFYPDIQPSVDFTTLFKEIGGAKNGRLFVQKIGDGTMADPIVKKQRETKGVTVGALRDMFMEGKSWREVSKWLEQTKTTLKIDPPNETALINMSKKRASNFWAKHYSSIGGVHLDVDEGSNRHAVKGLGRRGVSESLTLRPGATHLEIVNLMERIRLSETCDEEFEAEEQKRRELSPEDAEEKHQKFMETLAKDIDE